MATVGEKPVNLRGLDYYDSLIKAEIQRVVDNAVFYEPGDGDVEGELPTSEINDNVTALDSTWSSEKISEMITNSSGGGAIDDNTTGTESTWSSEKIAKLFNLKINKVNPLDDNVDLNTVIDSGMYRLNETYTNGPDDEEGTMTYGWGQLLVIHGGADTLAQIIFPFHKSQMVFRTGNPLPLNSGEEGSGVTAGIWHDWKVVATSDDLAGYLPLTAGADNALTGNLYIGETKQVAIGGNAQALVTQAINSARTNSRQLILSNTDYNPDIKYAVTLKTNENGESAQYAIYGEHNLPTALQANDAGVVEVLSADAAQTFAVYHEGNAPTAEVVGAAPVEDHNIRTYTSLDQIGLSNDDMSSTDFLTNIKAINTALGDGDTILYLTTTNADNLHLSAISKLNADTGKSLDGSSTLSIKISRTGNIYNAITTDLVYNSGAEATYIYSCIYNKEADAADDTLSKFVITTHPEGFMPSTGGNITGELTINGNEVYHAGNLPQTKSIDIQVGTEDLEAGVSPLPHGSIYLVLEEL